MDKKGHISQNDAIDHVMANHLAKDFGIAAQVDYTRWLSDHFPIVCSFLLPFPAQPCWRLPKPLGISCKIEPLPQWDQPLPESFQAWNERALNWICAAFGVPRVPRGTLTTTYPEEKKVPRDHRCATALAMQRLIHKARGLGFVGLLRRKIMRQAASLGIQGPESLEDFESHVSEWVLKHVEEKANSALKSWKEKVASWLPASKEIFHYIRNPLPAKSVAVKDRNDIVRDSPAELVENLNEYWARLEQWPSASLKNAAEDKLDDHYSLYAPRVDFHDSIQLVDLVNQVAATKKSAQGLDGWTVQEIKSLPCLAWSHLLELWPKVLAVFASTPLCRFKRVPIEKSDKDVPRPGDLRPIDIFPVIVRIFSSAAMAKVRGWALQVVHPSQYATHGGVPMALTKLNFLTETCHHGTCSRFGIALDFMKLFNTPMPRT